MHQDIRRQLENFERALIVAPARRPFETAEWAADIPAGPGVYALWDLRSGEPRYVGESASLRKRMSDFGRSVNHTARRKLAKHHRCEKLAEKALSDRIGQLYRVSLIEVGFGRTEVEEYLTLKWAGPLLNSRTQRAHRAERFEWVEPSAPKRLFERHAV